MNTIINYLLFNNNWIGWIGGAVGCLLVVESLKDERKEKENEN